VSWTEGEGDRFPLAVSDITRSVARIITIESIRASKNNLNALELLQGPDK
jgi:hypothetical protein